VAGTQEAHATPEEVYAVLVTCKPAIDDAIGAASRGGGVALAYGLVTKTETYARRARVVPYNPFFC
jgi:hypothetical protein